MRLKSALRRGVAAAVIAGIVVSSGIPAYAAQWDIADGNITVKAGDAEGTNRVTQGEKDVEDTDTVITGESKENTVTIDTSEGNVDVTFDDLKIDVSGKKEGNGSGDSPVRESKAAVTVQGDHDATIELDGKNELKSGSYNAGLEKNGHEAEGTLTIKDDKGKDGSLTAEGGDGGGAGIGGGKESTGSSITIRGGTIEAVGGSSAAGIGDGAYRASDDTDDPNPGKLYICGDAEVTAKAGSQMMTDAKAPCSDHKKVRAADGGLPFLSELAQNHLAAHALPEVSGKEVPAGFVLKILHDFCDSVRLMRLIRRREPWRDNVRRCRGRSRRCFCLRFRGALRVPSRHGGRRRPICR